MNGSKHISNCYSALQGLYWMSYGAIYTFAAVVLPQCFSPLRLRQLTGESGFLCGL